MHVGTSGWAYRSWRGPFYPPGLRQREELAFAARTFGTLEINASFYRLQSPATYARWAQETPDDFVFAVKGSRFITHMRKLRNVEDALANFYASGVLMLGAKLGPFVWQLPPRLTYHPDVIEAFLTRLPRRTTQAAALSQTADRFDTTDAPTPEDRPLRHALEVRHESFLTEEFTAQLRRHGVALAVADAAGLYPLVEESTTDFMYVRLHGASALYSSGYTPEELAVWAQRLRAWQRGEPSGTLPGITGEAPRGPQDVYVYFDNDIGAHAPADAAALHALLSAAD
ncbi:DUF72 domain-containing protein [Deinococcus maricopensis]|uniref:DUF72 domain-containing protein n=1 Tax=Deinococcus maricopensis (strain DSM 21211 / LMG 22137 / NRRL B-23946 / LB-34) TaxID=709986 RepID=E8UBK3_DEIML|nr:DUF72 domain-containing protein [Deinococcus maricopensis]ADV68442.1 protein of unknown function DUF72 [Deinococcus maricopensis DSM 21211]